MAETSAALSTLEYLREFGSSIIYRGNYEKVLTGQIASFKKFPAARSANPERYRYLMEEKGEDIAAIMIDFGTLFPEDYQKFVTAYPQSVTGKAKAARDAEERALDEQIEAAKRALTLTALPAATSNYGLTPVPTPPPTDRSAGDTSASQTVGIGKVPDTKKLVLIGLLIAALFVLYPVIMDMLKNK